MMRATRPPVMPAPCIRPPVDYTPPPSNLKPLLVRRCSSMPEMIPAARPRRRVDGKVLYEAWWLRVRPASGEKAGAEVVQSSVAPASGRQARPRSQVEGGHDAHLRDVWWSSVRHGKRTFPAADEKRSSPLNRGPTSSSDEFRHHDFTLCRAAGARWKMRKNTSNRAKPESPIIAETATSWLVAF
ncbi:hypothetical protein T484DRAFT_1959169 [Baffinella frigidus]|nr:hypothetical protein T484DRAFT_1959169 [Cryptophyta sp. CCMP2293]